MHKRERLENTILGEQTDRPPVAAWRHFPGDDQRAADLARAHIDFVSRFDWDFITVLPASQFMVVDYGLHDVWQGDRYGLRDIVKTPVKRTLHWTDLRPIDPNRGQFGKQLQCLQLMRNTLTDDTPIIQAVYSPLTQARLLGGTDLLLRSMRTQPDRLRTGLNSITETTLRFVEALRRTTRIDGIFYISDFVSYTQLADSEYAMFGLPYDTKILESITSEWWLNIAQLNGRAPMLHLFEQLPIQALNWSTTDARPSLERVKLDFDGAYCGGLSENYHLNLGTPTTIRDAIRESINIMGRRSLIIGHGRTAPITVPLSNYRAIREAVELTLR